MSQCVALGLTRRWKHARSGAAAPARVGTPQVPPLREGLQSPYYDQRIMAFAAKAVTPVTLRQLMAQQKGSPARKRDDPARSATRQTTTKEPTAGHRLIESANFLLRELPVRLAKRVTALQNLPLIVGVNPWIKTVRQLYYDSFRQLSNFSPVKTDEDEREFTRMLTELVDQHNETLSELAHGFRECRPYMALEPRTAFLDEMIRARIGIRVLAEHHLALHEEHADWVGIIHTRLSPAALARTVAADVAQVCELNHGSAPKVVIDGHVDCEFAYVPVHLEYMLTEALKNAMGATVETTQRTGRGAHPPVEITVGCGARSVAVRIRDQGGGIPYAELARAWEYSHTTARGAGCGLGLGEGEGGDVFARVAQAGLEAASGGPMAGLGFGLPMARLYAEYFGGSFELHSVHGFGCDAVFRLPSISLLSPHAVNV